MRVAIEILGTPVVAVKFDRNSSENPGCSANADGTCILAGMDIADGDEITVVGNASGQYELADLPSDDDDEDDDEDRNGCVCRRQIRRRGRESAKPKQRFGF